MYDTCDKREVLEKSGKPQKNGQKWANLLNTNFQSSSSEWCDDHFSLLTYLFKAPFWPSGIEGQNEPFSRSVVTKLIEWHWFLSCRVAWRENMGKINNFEKSAKMGQKMFFLKILKNTHQKIRSKATQKCGLTHDFL